MPGPFDQGWRRIVIGASGPSFSADQAALIERARVAGRCRVIAINTTALTLLPHADALFSNDPPWWHRYSDAGPGPLRWSAFGGQRWTGHAVPAKQYGARLVPSVAQPEGQGVNRDLGKINRGGNSGYAAVNLAYLFGAECIALVGFDLRWDDSKRTHHHGNHPSTGQHRLANPTEAALKTWAGRFDALARDLEAANVGVVNCSPGSALRCFECVPLEEILGP